MSALPPKADIETHPRNVCFVPIADILACRPRRKTAPHNLCGIPKLLSRNRNWGVTESLQLNGSSIACRVSHEFEMAGAANFFGLVKSRSMVVVSVTARERSEHRSLVLAIPLSSRTTD